MFNKLVAIEPVHLTPAIEQQLHKHAKEVIFYPNKPQNEAEVSLRIADADAVFVSYTTKIEAEAILKADNLKYIGMCCSLYDEKSATVNLAAARNKNVLVSGVNDYGDVGVGEFVVSELVQLLHGYTAKKWDYDSRELAGLKVGIIGLGVTGLVIARAMQCFGADISYFSKTRKPAEEAKNIKYQELDQLLADNEVICTCVNKNIILLHEEQFAMMGPHKILINTGGTPTFDLEPFTKFINEDNYFICDMSTCLGADHLLGHPNIRCVGEASGMTIQAKDRLSQKVLANLEQAKEQIFGR